MTPDSILTFVLITGAAIYLFRRFFKTRKGGGCSCSAGSGCCGQHDGSSTAHSCGSKS